MWSDARLPPQKEFGRFTSSQGLTRSSRVVGSPVVVPRLGFAANSCAIQDDAQESWEEEATAKERCHDHSRFGNQKTEISGTGKLFSA